MKKGILLAMAALVASLMFGAGGSSLLGVEPRSVVAAEANCDAGNPPAWTAAVNEAGTECQLATAITLSGGTITVTETLHILGGGKITTTAGLTLNVTGNLIIDTPTGAQGSNGINANDTSNPGSAFPIVINAAGDVTLHPGALIQSRNTIVAGNGNNVTINAGGNFQMDGTSGAVPGARIDTGAGGASQNSAGNVTLDIGGDFEMEPGSSIKAESNQNGNGGAINITVDGDMTLRGSAPPVDGALISSRVLGGTGGDAGDITIIVGPRDPDGNCIEGDGEPEGTLLMEPGSAILGNTPKGAAASIEVSACRDIIMDGLIESFSNRSGTGAVQGPGGGPITLDAGCDLTITDGGKVSSRGQDPGADLVHLEGGCDVVVYGLVESSGLGAHAVPNKPANHCNNSYRPDKPAASTTCVEVWAGNSLTIDSDSGEGHSGEINADHTGTCGGRNWVDLFARGDILIDGEAAGNYAVHANVNCATNQTGGIVTVKSTEGSVTATDRALAAEATGAGGSGGVITVEAAKDVTLNTASVLARGDSAESGGYGKGGKVNLRAFTGTASWENGLGDVRPTGTDNVGTVLPAANRGEINLTDCTVGPVSVAGSTFPNNGLPTTTPTITNDCSLLAPTLQDYVKLPDCPCDGVVGAECQKSGTKFNDINQDGDRDAGEPGIPNWEIRAYVDADTNGVLDALEFGAPFLSEVTDGNGDYLFTLTPGAYIFCEVLKGGWTQSYPTDNPNGPDECAAGAPLLGAQGWAETLAAGDVKEGNDFGNFQQCKWCTKGAVLSQVAQNMGVCCAVPDILVDLRMDKNDPILASELGSNQPATGSIQKAIDYVNSSDWLLYDPTPGDGEIFIGVTAQDCGTGTVGTDEDTVGDAEPCEGQTGRGPGGHDGPEGYENVIIKNTRSERLNVFGCSVDLQASNPDVPVIEIKDSVGKVTVLDIHVWVSHDAGYYVHDNADLVIVKNSRSIGGSGIGYKIFDSDVEITGAPEISNNDIGVLIGAGSTNVKLRTNNGIMDNGIGIKIVGNGNETNDNDVGQDGHPNGTGIIVDGNDNHLHGDDVSFNTGDGIVVNGSGTVLAKASAGANEGNFLEDEDSHDNGDDGFVVSGNFNVLDRNKQTKSNGGDGIEVSGANNLLNENVVEENTGDGVKVGGSTNTLDGNDAKKNGGDGIELSGNSNTLNENSAEDNDGHGINISGNLNKLETKNEANKNGANNTFDGIHITGDDNVLTDNSAEDNLGHGIKADTADGASGNDFKDNEGKGNGKQGIRACGQDNLGGNTGSGNGQNPQVDFLCTPPGPAVFFIADDQDNTVYKYDAVGILAGSFALHADNDDPSGVAVVGSDVYVLDSADKKVYRYDAATGAHEATSLVLKQLLPTAGGNLSSPAGLAIDGDNLWIADDGNTELLQYSLAAAFGVGVNLNAVAEVDFNLSSHTNGDGLAIDANCLYVLDGGDKVIYTYDRPEVGGACAVTISKGLKELGGGGLGSPTGATVNGSSLWVVDAGKVKAYQYPIASLFPSGSNLNATSEFALDPANDDANGM